MKIKTSFVTASILRDRGNVGADLAEQINNLPVKADTVYLVTANYHMPRLFLELRNQSPDIKIIPISVQADSKPLENIWMPKNFSLLIIEFFKFITKKVYFSISNIFNIKLLL